MFSQFFDLATNHEVEANGQVGGLVVGFHAATQKANPHHQLDKQYTLHLHGVVEVFDMNDLDIVLIVMREDELFRDFISRDKINGGIQILSGNCLGPCYLAYVDPTMIFLSERIYCSVRSPLTLGQHLNFYYLHANLCVLG